MPTGIYIRKPGSRKPDSMASRESKSQSKRGNKNPHYTNGNTNLYWQIKNCYKMKDWRKQIKGRDKGICQECGKPGTDAHHLTKVKDILEIHNITTIAQAIKCKELWDIDGGLLLCSKCHKLYDRNNII